MYVCLCHAVTDRDICDAAARGIVSMSALSRELKVATCCGRCRDCACRILDEAVAGRCALAAAEPLPA